MGSKVDLDALTPSPLSRPRGEGETLDRDHWIAPRPPPWERGYHILQTQQITKVMLVQFSDGDGDRREHELAQAVALHKRDRSKQSPDLNLSQL